MMRTMLFKFLGAGLFICLLFTLFQQLFASHIQKVELDYLVQRSTMVVTGKVESLQSFWNDKKTKIYTYVIIKIDKTIKGEPQGKVLMVKQLGGIVGDIGMKVDGMPEFREQEEVLLFLEPRPDSKNLFRVIGMYQGKYSILIDKKADKKIVITDLVKKQLEAETLTKFEKQYLDDMIHKIKVIMQNN